MDDCGKNGMRQAKAVAMTDEEFCIMALLACKPAKRASEELEDQRRGDISVHCKAYGAALCHDARMLQVACHSHDCTFTCVKNQKKKDAPEESLKVHKTPLCRFHFFRALRLAVETTVGWVTKAF